MNTQEEKLSWEERFDYKFTTNRNAHIGAPENENYQHIITKSATKDLKQFISQELTRAREEEHKRMVKILNKLMPKKCSTNVLKGKRCWLCQKYKEERICLNTVRHCLIQEALTHITTNTNEK